MDIPFEGITIQPTYTTSLNSENSLHFYQQYMCVPVDQYPCQHRYCQLFNFGHYIRCVIASLFGVCLHFPDYNEFEFFVYFFTKVCSLFEEPIHFFCQFYMDLLFWKNINIEFSLYSFFSFCILDTSSL